MAEQDTEIAVVRAERLLVDRSSIARLSNTLGRQTRT